MIYKRFILLFSAILFCFSALSARLFIISTEQPLAEAANQQSASVLTVASTRGVVYDRKLRPLTGIEVKNIAAVQPNERTADILLREAELSKREELLNKFSLLRPFLWEVSSAELIAPGLQVFPVPQRYLDNQPAVHIIGQLDKATGKGASGMEKAYDTLLSSGGGVLQVRYTTDALRHAISLTPPDIIDTGYLNGSGIVLTLDREIQIVAQKAAEALGRGAIIVMNPYTGDILAAVSTPTFDPNHPERSINSVDAPFFNRAFAAYSVGSVFKLLTAATALETGIEPELQYDCEGLIEVKEQVFHCHNLAGHGLVDMREALNRSCNPYFINLALKVGGPNLVYKAQQLGFGERFEVAPGFFTASGTLPDKKELTAPAATANFGFGQGVLTATPVQIATLVSSIANGGGAVTPRLVSGTTISGRAVDNAAAAFSVRPVFDAEAAGAVREMMVSVVEEGSGKNALPKHGGAGGKTASAQTGQFKDGKEIIHAWFAGFYPAEKPRYTIVVLCEGGDSGSDAACPVFKAVADGIWELEQK